VGVHGIIINFKDKRGEEFSATYLPEVAAEHGMYLLISPTPFLCVKRFVFFGLS